MTIQRLRPETTAVIVVDVQERLAPAMPEDRYQDLLRSSRILLGAAGLFSSPVLATEQYPGGLGPTVPEIAATLEELQVSAHDKLSFSAWDNPGFADELRGCKASTAIVIGMEAHVCVYQTVRDLVEAGVEVYVPIDGVCSRRDDHREVGIDLCVAAGAVRTTTESIVFDWLRVAGSDEFKALSKLIR
jgi:nicotinamidase-related amidase